MTKKIIRAIPYISEPSFNLTSSHIKMPLRAAPLRGCARLRCHTKMLPKGSLCIGGLSRGRLAAEDVLREGRRAQRLDFQPTASGIDDPIPAKLSYATVEVSNIKQEAVGFVLIITVDLDHDDRSRTSWTLKRLIQTLCGYSTTGYSTTTPSGTSYNYKEHARVSRMSTRSHASSSASRPSQQTSDHQH